MKITKSQLKQIIKEGLNEIFAPGERSSEAEESDALEDARRKVMTQLRALLINPDAKAARITPEKIDRITNGFWRVLVEEQSLKEARTEMGFEQLLEEFLKQQEEFEGTSAEEMAMGLKNAWSRMSDKVVGESPPITHIMDPPPPKEKPAKDWLALFEKDELKQMIKKTLQEVV